MKTLKMFFFVFVSYVILTVGLEQFITSINIDNASSLNMYNMGKHAINLLQWVDLVFPLILLYYLVRIILNLIGWSRKKGISFFKKETKILDDEQF